MGAIVYLSDFGPMKDPVFPLWWHIAVVAGFSIVIDFMGDAGGTAGGADRPMIGEVLLPEEGELEGSAEEPEPLTGER